MRGERGWWYERTGEDLKEDFVWKRFHIEGLVGWGFDVRGEVSNWFLSRDSGSWFCPEKV